MTRPPSPTIHTYLRILALIATVYALTVGATLLLGIALGQGVQASLSMAALVSLLPAPTFIMILTMNDRVMRFVQGRGPRRAARPLLTVVREP